MDWAGLLRLGVGRLGLRPSQVWALTPGELRLMLGPEISAPLGRGGLDALMARYPDHGPDQQAKNTKGGKEDG